MKFVLMAVMVCSLCFSVGEGLRLTPFAVTDLSAAKDACGLTKSTYGPLDVPSQVQKRTKRQTTDFGPQPSAQSSPVLAIIPYRIEDQSVPLRSALFVSRPAGRAPPFLA